MFKKVKSFKGQDYGKLKSQSVSTGQLFVDQEFPPEAKSLYFSKQPPGDVEWKRPGVSNFEYQ